MGNSATKEQRQVPTRLRSDSRRGSSAAISGPNSPSVGPPPDLPSHHPLYGSRSGRGSQTNLSSLLGIGHGSDRERDSATAETRRESKQERDQRRLERDRVNREKERARSMRDENVDGGYLVTQGVYTGLEDFNKSIVRHLMIERRLAPFWKGLNDHSESWTEHQLVAAARGLPIPAADAIPQDEQSGPVSLVGAGSEEMRGTQNQLTVPASSSTHRSNPESMSSSSPDQPNFPFPTSSPSTNISPSGPAIFRGRSKTLATLTGASKASSVEMMPREKQLPKDPFVNGQPIEAYLYKDALECPICFIYYPPYLNRTRCCDQIICSECFVQIKRPDPHLREHQDPSSQDPGEPPDPDAMVSEIAKCPFCKQPDLGVTYQPPPFQRGLTYVSQASAKSLGKVASAMSSSSSLASAMSGGKASSVDSARKRAQSISANDPAVITTDRVRPDWHLKLEGARAHAARRSAAATALHTAAYIMGSRGQEPDSRGLGAFGRRALLRRGSGPASSSAGDTSAQMNILALMAERYGVPGGNRNGDGQEVSGLRGSSRRARLEDLEEVMMMEAIRMSLASEDDRRKKEEEESKGSKKEAKKEAKKKEKELKKAEKDAKKSGIYGSASQSSTDLRGEYPQTRIGKGKGIQLPDAEAGSENAYTDPSSSTQFPFATSSPFTTDGASDDPQLHLERARAQLQPEISSFASPTDTYPYRQPHLRSQSSASSTDDDDDSVRASLGGRFRGSGSSFEVSPSGSGINVSDGGTANLSGTPPGGGAGVEPMFNFRSLAAMVGHDDEKAETKHEEHVQVDEATDDTRHDDERSRGESSSNAISGPLAKVVGCQLHTDDSMVSRSYSTRTAPGEAFHDALESATGMPPPEVNIIAPSRTGSDLVSMSKAEEAKEMKVPEKEVIKDTSARSIVS